MQATQTWCKIQYLQFFVIAAITDFTVEEPLPAAHSTDTTIFTVKLFLLCVIVKEDTFHASILSKGHMAMLTLVTNRLSAVTQGTHKLSHFLSIQLMTLVGVLQEVTSVHTQMQDSFCMWLTSSWC